MGQQVAFIGLHSNITVVQQVDAGYKYKQTTANSAGV